MNKFILMHNAYTSTMVATAALAAAIGAATTAMAQSYPVLTSTGKTDQDHSFWNEAANWTNTTLNVSVPPSDLAASAYDYLLENTSLRSPSTSGLHVFHSHFFRVKNCTIREALASGVGTNRFENEGLRFHDGGGVSVMDNRYADVTYEGTILVTSEGTGNGISSFSAGQSTGSKASVLRLAGVLKTNPANPDKWHIQCGANGLGSRVVIEADSTDFIGTLHPRDSNGWVNFSCAVFNGTVATWHGAAIGTERATSMQLKALNINSAGTTLIVPFSESAGRTGTITVTNAFSQAGTITVQLRGDLPPPGKYPVLRLAADCTGDFDQTQFSFGGFVTDLRAARTVSNRYAATALSFATEGDGSRVLYANVPDLPTVVTMR